MTDERLAWFPCEPGPLLGALAGMASPKKLTYLIMLLRIYECGGACPDALDAIARRTGLNKRVTSDALDELFREGRLVRGEGGIRNPKADAVIAESRVLFQKRKSDGAKAANRRWQKEKQKQGKQDATPNATAMPNDAHRHIQIQDSLFPNGNRAQEPESKPVETAAMKDPPLDPEADYYRRGREVLGASAGGMLTQLLRAKGGNVALARSALEQASTRGDAKQYVGAMVRGFRGGNGHAEDRGNFGAGGVRNGYATLAGELRRKIDARGVGGAAGPSGARDAPAAAPGDAPGGRR